MRMLGRVTTLLFLSVFGVLGDRGVLYVTETGECEGCGEEGEKRQCQEEEVSGPLAANWTVSRILELGLSKDNIDLEVINTCGNLNVAKWRLLHVLSNYNHTSNLHVVLGSTLNKLLVPSLASLDLDYTEVWPVSPRSTLLTVSRLARHIGWRQAVVLGNEEENAAIGSVLLGEEICVTQDHVLPSLVATKDTFSNIIATFRENSVKHIIVSGFGNQIYKFLRNLHELNVRVEVLVVPWDGALLQLVGTEMVNLTLVSVLPKNSVMSEFLQFYKDQENIVGEVHDQPLSWQIVKAMYGLLVLNDSSIDDMTAKEGLQLTREPTKYTVDTFNIQTKLWDKLGVYEEGEFSWGRELQYELACGWCSCVNGLYESKVSWRWDNWVTALATLSGLGIVCSLAVLIFLCSQCGQVLEGGQTTTFLLLAATTITFAAMLPYCFQPGGVVCVLRTSVPATSLTFLVAILLSRSLMLATADTEGLPGHASGCLQGALLLLMLGVELGLLGLETWHLRGDFLVEDECYHRSWLWLGLMGWPGFLLLVQVIVSPGIWRSRRNYKEGVLFGLASVAIALVTAAWVTVYVLCTELYGNHWEDISVCAGLVATGTVVLLIIFIPKVYLMTVWGSGLDLSLHLPGTTTSTLHTDTLDYVPSASIYKTPVDENTVAYVNLGPRDHVKPANPSVHYGSAYIMGTRTLMDQKQNLTYRLDRNTEPADNMSWEPFNSGQHPSSAYLSQSQPSLPQSHGIPSTRL